MTGTLLKRVELGSAVIAPYLVAIVWQYFCTLNHRSLAWAFTLFVSAIVWILFVWLNDDPSPRLRWSFWALVFLPLLFFYVIRLPFPDISFDVLNYHIFHGERALRGPLLQTGDFFPTAAPFNPTPDILTGLYRYVLGYRLGTVANLLALIWTGAIVERILQAWIKRDWLRSASTLAVLATEQLFFQINNYMVDLLALPLLLEGTRIALKANRSNRCGKQIILLSMLLGTAAAFKLTNLIYAAPIVLIFLVNVLAADRSPEKVSLWRLARIVPAAAVIFLLPLLPFTILIYRLTGNPVFPLYNGIFKSPYWRQGAMFDPRWGPYGIAETIGWPVFMFFRAARLSEYPFYSGRLSIGFVVALLLIFLARRERAAWQMAFITLFSAVAWSASSGYIRYALYLELTSGILMIWLIWYGWQKLRGPKTWRAAIVIAPLAILLLLQCSFALAHAYRWEWSGRETIFYPGVRYDLREAANVLRDRSLSRYIAPEDLKTFAEVDCWVETTYKTSAIAGLIKPEVPALGVRLDEYFVTPAARRKFAEVVKGQRGHRLFTLTDHENYEKAREELEARNLTVGSSRPVSIYYFSHSVRLDLLLVELLPKQLETEPKTGVRLPDNAFSATLSVVNIPQAMHPGQKYELRVVLKNESEFTWPGRQPAWQFQLTIGNRWLRQNGEKVNDVDGRVPLSEDLAPGATVELPLIVTAPSEPGIYILQLDAIQEGVAWFGDRGSEVLSLRVKVE